MGKIKKSLMGLLFLSLSTFYLGCGETKSLDKFAQRETTSIRIATELYNSGKYEEAKKIADNALYRLAQERDNRDAFPGKIYGQIADTLTQISKNARIKLERKGIFYKNK